MTFEQGQHVVVSVANADEWNKDVLDVLQGAKGTIATIKTHHNNGKESLPCDPRYLVAFDDLSAPTSRGMRYGWYWFDARDLKVAP